MKEIIWVFGTSASGKETFIKQLLNDTVLQKTLGIGAERIAVSEQSLINLGQLDESRSSIIDEVSELIKVNEAVVIKWQYGDTLLHTPVVLHTMYPMFRHVVVKLSVDHDEQIRRLRTKTWWHDEGSEDEFIANELKLVEDSIDELKNNFIITELQ